MIATVEGLRLVEELLGIHSLLEIIVIYTKLSCMAWMDLYHKIDNNTLRDTI